VRGIDAKREKYAGAAKEIWGFAEIGYQEQRAARCCSNRRREVDGVTTVDLFTDPTHIQKAEAEFDQKHGPSFVYKTRLADRKPALDYRK
jgi:hypothetical protein